MDNTCIDPIFKLQKITIKGNDKAGFYESTNALFKKSNPIKTVVVVHVRMLGTLMLFKVVCPLQCRHFFKRREEHYNLRGIFYV